MPHHTRAQLATAAAVLIALALLPLVADSYTLRLVTRMMIVGLFAMSLDLLVGYVGLVSLGHAAFYGVAVYAVGLLINKAGVVDGFALLAAALGAAAIAALAIGWLSIRTSGAYFIMITLALAQMLYYFVKDRRDWGGTDGFNISTKPKLQLAGTTLIDLYDRAQFYWLTLACLAACFALLVIVLRAPFGRVLMGIKANEPRMRALGYDVQRFKLVAFVIAGTIAGLAGYLEAARSTFVNPAHLSWHESGHVLMVVILGGMGTLWGPVLGAFVVLWLEDWLSTLTDRWLLAMGGFVLAVALFLPAGIAGLLRWRRRAPLPGGRG